MRYNFVRGDLCMRKPMIAAYGLLFAMAALLPETRGKMLEP